jgi:regulatory protein
VSLKMQAIGFLSRREHSRLELRRKLLDSLRKRAREEAALAAATEKAARELARALSEHPSNGIDDAFTPFAATLAPAAAPGRVARGGASRGRGRAGTSAEAPARAPAKHAADTPALDTLSLANGAPIPAALRISLAAAAAAAASATTTSAATRGTATPGASASGTAKALAPALTRSALAQDAFDDLAGLDDDGHDSAQDDASDSPSGPLHATDLELSDPEAAVDELLDWLVANKYLSEPRFVESRVNARSRKQGTLLIKLELSRHGLTLEPEQAAELRETEFARAQALWQRKFGELAPDAQARAKQARFLAARGFAASVVRRIVGGEEEF